MLRRSAGLSALLLLVSVPLLAQIPFSKLVVFGDSLSDTGNLYFATSLFGRPTPAPPGYTTGEYTDGPDSVPSTNGPVGLWVEQLAQKMGLPAPKPFATGAGLNYAVAGAQTGHDPAYTLGSRTQVPWTADQVNIFQAAVASIPSDALYVFWCGSNDILNNPGTAAAAANTAAANIQANIDTLASKGAKYFLWVDLPPLGEIPESINTANRQTLDAASVAYNQAMSSAVTTLKAAHAGITIITVDAYALFEVLIQNPSLYGLANVTGSAQGQTVNPNTYLFWDGLHPTTVGHDSVASVAYNMIQLAFGGPAYTCTNTLAPQIALVDSASAYGGYPYFASGSYLEIKGSNLADPADPRLAASGGQWTAADFSGLNAPAALDGISVSIDGKPGYISYISPGQINVQAPEDSTMGNVAITVTNCKVTSAQFTFAKQALAPGLLAPPSFDIAGKQYLVATFVSDGAYVLSTSMGAGLGVISRPAKPGDMIIAYGIGFGDVTPASLPGVMEEQSNTVANPVTFAFGNTNATVVYSGLAGNFVGLYEFYLNVPLGLASGDYQINVKQNGTALPQTFYLTVAD